MTKVRNFGLVVTLIGVILFALLGLYALFDAVAAGPGRRPAEVWEIPGGYKGLIIARFGVAECAPSTRRDGKLVYPIAADGTFCSSDVLPEGRAVDTYEYVYPDGRRVRLQSGDEVAKLVVRGSVEPDRRADLYVFVGSPEEQQRARDTLPRSFVDSLPNIA